MNGGRQYSLNNDAPGEDDGKRVTPTGNVVDNGGGVQTELRTRSVPKQGWDESGWAKHTG